MNKILPTASASLIRPLDESAKGQTSPYRDAGPNPSPEIRRVPLPPLSHQAPAAGSRRPNEDFTQLPLQSLPAVLDARQTQAPGNVRRARSVESVDAVAKDVFKKVRRAYNDGLKSSNKTYSPEIRTLANTFGLGKQNKDDRPRLNDASAVLKVIRQQTFSNARRGVEPAVQNKLVIDAANCGELARAAAKLATEGGMHAEVWQFDKGDHGFAVIGTPPAAVTVDFADWKNVWIVDPWTGVVSEAPNYVEKVSKKMQKWHSEGKVISEDGKTLAIDEDWLSAIRTRTKSRKEAPSPERPNPWAHLQTAVDVRRLVDDQDQRFRPIKIGDREVPRTELFDMGAVLDGKPIGIEGIPMRTVEGLAGRLNFDEDMLKQKVIEAGANNDLDAVQRMADILVEVSAYERSTDLKPLLVNSKGKVDGVAAVLNAQLETLRSLSSRAGTSAGERNPMTLVVPGKSAITFNNVGVGLQAFGVYNSVRGIMDAVARGDTADAAIKAAGIGAEAAGLASEVGFSALGKSFGKEGSARLAAFAGTSFGKTLGGPARIGSNISRAGGAAGALITLPFEVYGAATSFQNAAKSEGKTAQDHYVDGGLAVAGIAASLAATGAGAAGLAGAGPVGLIAAGVLIGASRVYHAARYVEDVSEKIELSASERVGAGLSAFFSGTIPQGLHDRMSVSDAGKDYRARYEADATKLMESNAAFGHVVYGDPIIEPRPPIQRRGPPNSFGGRRYETIQVPPLVKDNAANDLISARTGIESVANAVKAQRKQGSDVLWMTGGGDDVLVGAGDRSNHFVVGGGRKSFTGAQKNDVFELNSAPVDDVELDGGGGNNTLLMGFDPPQKRAPVRVVLPTVLRSAAEVAEDAEEPDQLAGSLRPGNDGSVSLRSIQNVVTSKSARTFVTGNDQDNLFVLNGEGDGAQGGRGNDTYVIKGGGRMNIRAGDGINRYHIADTFHRVIIDAPNPDSVHELKLDFNSSDFVVRAVDNSDKLEIVFDNTNPGKKIVISGVFTRNAAREIVPARKDGSIFLITRDGFIMTPTLSLVKESPDGLLPIGAMLATPAMGVVSQEQA